MRAKLVSIKYENNVLIDFFPSYHKCNLKQMTTFLRCYSCNKWCDESMGSNSSTFKVTTVKVNYVLSDFIDLTQVHNFTVSAQDIYTFRRLSVFTVSFTGILRLLMQIMKRFVQSY